MDETCDREEQVGVPQATCHPYKEGQASLMGMSEFKCVILAGGLGTRISEETAARPKPMVEIGGKPILWHVMKIYSAHGIR